MPYHTIPTTRPPADLRDSRQRSHVGLNADTMGWGKTATCPTCLNGCECTGPNPLNGCEHFGCWGPAATGTCPDVPVMRSKLFGGAA